MGELEGDVAELQVQSIIGFDGNILNGLKIHPDGQHFIFPLGNKVSVVNRTTKKQDFLSGHTNVISAVDFSHTGKYVASGQINHIGFKAMVIIWDFEKRSFLSQHDLHKVRVEAVMFSINDKYLMSLGGRDCGSVVVWDIEAGAPLSGTSASRGCQGDATTLCTCNRRDACFMTGGDGNLVIWSIDAEARSISNVDVNIAKLRRIIYCMDMDERDEICYCGTSTGDILKIRMNFHHDAEILIPPKQPIMLGCFTKISQKQLSRGQVDLYGLGVRTILLLSNGKLLIGAGDGTLDLVEETPQNTKKSRGSGFIIPSLPVLRVLRSTDMKSTITSLQVIKGKKILVGTIDSEIYEVDMKTFKTSLIVTSHNSRIYCVAFPYQFSEVFATASKDDVRVWNLATLQELLRIKVPNFSCSTVVFAHDGKSILTAWNDGIIRAFTPITGRLIYVILHAHNKGVSALAITHNGKILFSGGCEGQVRLWNISPYKQELACTLKEHNGPISEICVNKTDDEAVSASTEGSCIIWDIARQCRKQIILANTLFMCVRYYPTGVQILTGGSDRKLGYWEVLDGSLVREIEASTSGAVNSLDISPDGVLFLSGGNDQIVKLWKYQEGITTHIGVGHSGVITSVCFSPDNKYIVSTSAAGSIFIWKNPYGNVNVVPEIAIDNVEEKEVSVMSKRSEETIEDLASSRSSVRSGSGDHLVCCACPCNRVVQK